MYKLTLIFHDNPAIPDLMERWSNDFVPLADKLPGLRLVSVSHVDGGPAGPSEIRLIHDLIFDDVQAMTAAMQSPAGVAAGQCLVRLTRNAPGSVTMLFADHKQDAPRVLS
jgi:uncharacterized protein (TIGR02118 family)